MNDKGEAVCQRADAAFSEQAPEISKWREAASFCLARKVATLNGGSGGHTPDPRLQNSVAIKAAENLAAGICSGFMNSSDMWAQFEPSDLLPEEHRTDRYKKWLLNATRVMMRTFGPAGLYSRVYETVLDAVATGNGAMEVMGRVPGSKSPINFKTWDIGSYVIAENCAGIVDQCWRKFEYTISQAAKEWPDFNPRTWQGVKNEDRFRKTETYILEISPREEREIGQVAGAKGMPFQALVVHEPTKEVVEEYGFEEFPIMVYRFQRQAGATPWGTGPGIGALPDERSTNFFDACLGDAVGKQVEPPLAVHADDMRGPLDFRMGGISAIGNMANLPQRVFETGDLRWALEFQREKKKEIRDHFFNDLFTPFLNDGRTLKAAQVNEMAKDVLAVYAPFGHRFLEEYVTPFLERSFMVMLRQGLFGTVPPEAIIGNTFVYPKTVHQSRMALEIQNLAKQQVRQLLMDVQPVLAIDPGQADWLEMPEIMRQLGANSVVMPNVLATPEQFAMKQVARQQAMQQQQMTDLMAKFATKNPDHAAAYASALAGE